jgi:hypothetical protein
MLRLTADLPQQWFCLQQDAFLDKGGAGDSIPCPGSLKGQSPLKGHPARAYPPHVQNFIGPGAKIRHAQTAMAVALCPACR